MPPAHSPLTAGALAAGLRATIRMDRDPRPVLEDLLRREYGAGRALLTGSGTQALQLAIEAAWALVGGGRRVALPAYSCYDVGSAAVGAGAEIDFYDINPATLGPDWNSLERSLAAGARVAVIAPLYGFPVDWDAVEQIAAVHGALAVEDAAQGHGSAWRGRPLGSFGRISALSFGRGKGWTGGRGGALLLRTGEGAVRANLRQADRGFSVLVLAAAQYVLARRSMYWIPASLPWLGLGDTQYREPVPPAEMTRGAAAALLASREAALAEAAWRGQAAARWTGLVRASGLEPVEPIPGATPGYLRFPVVAPRDPAAVVGARSRAGMARGYPRTLPEVPEIAARAVAPGRLYPGAAQLARRLVTLPVHSLVRSGDLDLAGGEAIADHVAQAQQSHG